ncbi:MAG TPA: DNA polymerase III subunit beta [Thermoanaerobaculaceae bacterium]|nr:DNA polymerase III subunit beta [Thermoanaerobaculaceae bacterium]HRS17550.1 DNA polymerase III subunit beta [Thermoanaerobaculaceae bacterium]
MNRLALLEELQLIQGVVERRTAIPILSNILLRAEGDRLEMAATDLDVTVFSRCSAVVRQEGRTTVSGKVFFELIRSLPADSVDLSVQDARLAVRSGTFASQLAVLDAADFPTLPEAPEGQGFAVDLELLQRMIDHTAFAVSSEEGHFQYNAALLLLASDSMQMVATDGHRLAWTRVPCATGVLPFEQQLLPRKVLNQLRRLSAVEGARLYIGKGENHLAFRLSDRVLLSRIVEARFPQYERVLVRDNPLRALVGRHELQAALRRVALLASERTRGVQLQFEEDSLALTSVGFDLGQASEVVPCRYRGEPIRSLVNAGYVLEFLGAVESQEVEFQLRDGEGPVVLSPVLAGEAVGECLYVIMPIRV